MRLSDHALPRPGSPGPRPVASLGLPGRLATGLGPGKQDKGRGSRAKKSTRAGGPRPAPAIRRTTADLNFRFVHHVECSTRTIKKTEREHRNLIIEVMT